MMKSLTLKSRFSFMEAKSVTLMISMWRQKILCIFDENNFLKLFRMSNLSTNFLPLPLLSLFLVLYTEIKKRKCWFGTVDVGLLTMHCDLNCSLISYAFFDYNIRCAAHIWPSSTVFRGMKIQKQIHIVRSLCFGQVTSSHPFLY